MADVGRMVKELSVEEFSATLAAAPNFFVTQINRLPATEADVLRQKLHTSQARLVMIKRRLSERALERLHTPGLSDLVDGSVGFVFTSGDILQAAKLLIDFRKTHEEQLVVRGALIDGQLFDTTRVEQLAQLPPRPMLLAQVVLTIESPITDVIMTLEQLLGDLAWVAEQVAAHRPAAPTGANPPGQGAASAPGATPQEASGTEPSA